MQITDELIRGVVKDVLSNIRNGTAISKQVVAPAGNSHFESSNSGDWGVFNDVNSAVAAATNAQKAFDSMGIAARKKAVDCVRKICIDNAEMLGREEFEETKIGRLKDKVQKLTVCAEKTLGVEWLRTEAYAGDLGVTVQEFAPFGVVGIVTPVTHSLPTLAGNAINILAAGNSLVCNPHPGGAKIACKGAQLFNQAIHKAIGIGSLINVIRNPTLESAKAIFDHRDVKLLCVTGGPAVGRAALRSPKRAIVAGPGNPPVVVDETADLENAAKSIVEGAAYDNNLLCIGEKEVFAVCGIFDELMETMKRCKAVRLNTEQIAKLTKAAFVRGNGESSKLSVNKELIGLDAAVLAKQAGMSLPADTELLFGETEESHPFVDHEQMMPFLPFVRVPDVNTAIALAKKYEHGFRHTAVIHSRNIDTITRMGKEMDVTLYVQNGPSTASLGGGGEGYLSFSIATPTGEGVTTPLTFTRQRRSTTAAGGMRVM